MKGKLQQQIQSTELEHISAEQVRTEINRFRQAVDSYPARAAKEPSLSFHQHLGSFFVTDQNNDADRSRRR